MSVGLQILQSNSIYFWKYEMTWKKVEVLTNAKFLQIGDSG